MNSGSRTARHWMGARLDLHAVRRDTVLAGVFSGLNALAGTLDWAWIVPGMLFGAGLGSILHLLPAEPAPHLLVGAITGGTWYVLWGFWETRSLQPRS